MKKIIYTSIFILLLSSIIPAPTRADIPPPVGSHNVAICNTITNLADFSEIAVIARASGPVSDPSKGTLVETDKCFGNNLYKFSNLDLYWATKNDLSSIDVTNLNKNNALKKLNVLSKNVPFIGEVVLDNTFLIKKNVEYSLFKQDDGTYTVYKSKVTSIYNDGRPNGIEIISNPTNIKKIIPVIDDANNKQAVSINENPFPTQQTQPIVKRSFWQKIKCFFGSTSDC